jgi:hypothetical protein
MYVVMTSTAKMPASVRAPYRRVAVVQLTPDYAAANRLPKMISERARGVVRVIDFGKFPAAGSTPRSGLVSALQRAEEMARGLNAGRPS